MTKNKLSIAPPDKKKTLEAFFRYYELSRLLFGQKQNEIYDVTDIPKTNKFYELAKEIAKQLEIDWENMTHEESNRVMLALLEDSFNLIRDIDDLYAQKISDITNIPYPYIIALRDNGLLNQKEARDKLIRHDYWKLMKTNKFTHNQILEKLSGIYDVNKRKILYAIKVKTKRVYYCRQCGLQLSKVKYMRNDGICDKCISKQIKL